MAGLEDLERVDDPDRGGDHRYAGDRADDRVRGIPLAPGPRRHEAQQQRVGAHQRRPAVEPEDQPALAEADAQEAVVEVVLVGAERRAPVADPLEDHERGVEDRHGEHQQRGGQGDRGGALQHSLHGQRADGEAEHQCAGVAHEGAGRVEVVTQEGQRRAADDRRHRRDLDALEGDREDGEGQGGDRHQAGGEPVDAVDQVDQVGDQGDPQDGDRVGEPAELDDPHHRQADLLDADAVADDGNQADGQDQDQLHEGPHATDVVPQADGGDQRDPDDDALDRAVDVDEDQRRHEDPGDDRQAPDPRYRPGVHPRTVASGVDGADLQREPDDQRRKGQHDHRREQEPPHDGALADEGVQ